jgi:hypothetical protein
MLLRSVHVKEKGQLMANTRRRAMTTSGLATWANNQPEAIKEVRMQRLMRSWHEKAIQKRGLLSTVSLIPLAACGGGGGDILFRADLPVDTAVTEFASLRLNGYSIKDTSENIHAAIANNDLVLAGATQIALSSNDAITAAQANAFAALSNFVGFAGVVAISDSGTFAVADRIDTYVLSDLGNTVNVFSNNVDVNVIGRSGADTINVAAGLTVTGTYALGAGSNRVVLSDGVNISGATITAIGGSYSVELAEDASATMTIAQNEFVILAAGTNTITLSNAGTATARAAVEHYKLADGTNTFNLHGDTRSVLGGSGNDVIQTKGVASLSGVTIDGGDGFDTLAVTDADSNISGAVLTSVENITLATGLNATMTIAQNALVTTAAGTNTITLSNSGTTTGAAQVESYILANAAGNDFTLGAGGQNVTGTGTQNDIVRTGAQTVVSGTIDLAGGTDQLIISSTDTDISTATLTGVEQVNLDQNVNATMTIAQNALVTNAAGTNTITLSNFGTATARATVEHYKLADGTNTFNLHGDTLSVLGGIGVDVIQTNGVTSLSGVTIDGGDGFDTLAVTDDDSNISGAVLTSIENITLATNLNATMTTAQNALVTTAAGTNTITLSDVGTATGATQVETYNIQAASTFVLGRLDQNVTEIQTDQENAASTLVFGAGVYTGRFGGFNAADILRVIDGTDLSAVRDGNTGSSGSGLHVGVLDFQNANATVTLNAAQNGSLTILASGASSGVQTIRVNQIDTFTGDANIETYQITAGSTFTLGSFSQNATELGSGDAEKVSTIVFGSGDYTGQFTAFESNDVLKVVNGTNLSGTNLMMGVVDFQNQNATVTMSAAQHSTGFTFDKFAGDQTVVLTTAGTVTGKTGIEHYTLSDLGGTTFTQVAGNYTITSGRNNDTIITSGNDQVRGQLTVDLTAGGQNTVILRNDAWDGEGLKNTAANQNSSIEKPNEWNFVSGSNETGVNIVGFQGGAGGDRLNISFDSSSTTISFVEEDYVLGTGGKLGNLTSGSIIELKSSQHTLGDSWTLKQVAELLSGRGDGDALVGLKNGNYTVAIYSAKDSPDADAHLFNIRVGGGDGLDFSIVSGNSINSQADNDMIEYVGTLRDVGSDILTAANFI